MKSEKDKKVLNVITANLIVSALEELKNEAAQLAYVLDDTVDTNKLRMDPFTLNLLQQVSSSMNAAVMAIENVQIKAVILRASQTNGENK